MTLHPYKQTTCIPRLNYVETVVSTRNAHDLFAGILNLENKYLTSCYLFQN